MRLLLIRFVLVTAVATGMTAPTPSVAQVAPHTGHPAPGGAIRTAFTVGRPTRAQPPPPDAAIRAAYARIESGVRTRDTTGMFTMLAPDATHYGLGRPTRTRAEFVASMPRMFAALDTLHAFTIVVDSVRVAGDSATAWYHERMAATFRPRAAGEAPQRMDETSWWADRWARTAAGWQLVRLVEVPAPAGRGGAPPR